MVPGGEPGSLVPHNVPLFREIGKRRLIKYIRDGESMTNEEQGIPPSMSASKPDLPQRGTKRTKKSVLNLRLLRDSTELVEVFFGGRY